MVDLRQARLRTVTATSTTMSEEELSSSVSPSYHITVIILITVYGGHDDDFWSVRRADASPTACSSRDT